MESECQKQCDTLLDVEMSCFICEVDDGRILYKVCKCSTLAHRDCMEHVIRRVRAHNTQCPACCTPYDVASHRVHDVRLIGRFARETIIAYVTTFSLAISTFIVFMVDRSLCSIGSSDSCLVVVVLGAVTMLFLCLAIMFHMSNARLCCVGIVERLADVSLNVPRVQQL